jgi:uncharacterized membrane protein YkoI
MPITRTLLLSLTLACASAWGEEEEKIITLDQLPPAVKAAVLKQANGAKIDEIEEETKKGKTVYEVKIGNTEYTFDATGKVLRAKVEKDDDEDEDDEKEDGKHKEKEKHKEKHKPDAE